MAERQPPQRRPPPTRDSSKSPARAARKTPRLTAPPLDDDDDDDDDDDAASEIATDRALALFLRRPPAVADHWVCAAYTAAGEQIVQDRSTAETRARPVELANDTFAACQRWAASEGRQTRFRIMWMASDRVLASHQWTCGDGDPSALDGTVESFLSQQQRHSETNHRLHLEGFQLVAEAQRTLLASAMRRIDSLESKNELLREKLRKANDVDADIAVQQVAADLESRVRATDSSSTRFCP